MPRIALAGGGLQLEWFSLKSPVVEPTKKNCIILNYCPTMQESSNCMRTKIHRGDTLSPVLPSTVGAAFVV